MDSTKALNEKALKAARKAFDDASIFGDAFGATEKIVTAYLTALAEQGEAPQPVGDTCLDGRAEPVGGMYGAYTPISVGCSTEWMRKCATEGCANPAAVIFERGDVGSHYCHDCIQKIQELPARPKSGSDQ